MTKIKIKLLAVACALAVSPISAWAMPIDRVDITRDGSGGYDIHFQFVYYTMRVISASGDNPGKDIRLHLQLTNQNTLSPPQLSDLSQTQHPAWDAATKVPIEVINYQGGTNYSNIELNILLKEPVHFSASNSGDLREVVLHIDAPPSNAALDSNSVVVPAPSAVSAVPSSPNIKPDAVVAEQLAPLVIPKTAILPSTPPASVVQTAPAAEALSAPLSSISNVPDETQDAAIPAGEKESLEEAKQEIIRKHFMPAVGLYDKLLKSNITPATRMQAAEFRGVALEKAGLLADARADYENYLKAYPSGAYSKRVSERLDALVSASDPLHQRLKDTPAVAVGPQPQGVTVINSGTDQAVGGSVAGVTAQPGSSESDGTVPSTAQGTQEEGWTNSFFGSINSQYGFSNFQTKTSGVTAGQTSSTTNNTTIQNALPESLDLNNTLRKGTEQYTARFSGSDQTPLSKDGHAQGNVSALSLEYQDSEEGLTARIGRQGATTGGVLGFFDGVFLSKRISDTISTSMVAGTPVTSAHTGLDTNKDFVGVDTDIAAFDRTWNFNLYAIEQINKGYTDRQAVGGTARTGNADYSIYTASEFDINLKALNFITVNGSYNLPDYHTSFYGTADYRRTPLALVSNAMIGQQVTNLQQLHQLYTSSQIDQYALDRTTFTSSATVGARYEFSPTFQVTPNVSVTQTGSMKGSGGVAPSPSLGTQYNYSFSVINSNVMLSNDSIVTSLSYGQFSYGNSYTANLSDSFPVNDDLNLGASLNGGYLTSKVVNTSFVSTGTPGNYRINYGPSLNLDYRFTNNLSFSLSGSINWSSDYSTTTPVTTVGESLQTGVRYSF